MAAVVVRRRRALTVAQDDVEDVRQLSVAAEMHRQHDDAMFGRGVCLVVTGVIGTALAGVVLFASVRFFLLLVTGCDCAVYIEQDMCGCVLPLCVCVVVGARLCSSAYEYVRMYSLHFTYVPQLVVVPGTLIILPVGLFLSALLMVARGINFIVHSRCVSGCCIPCAKQPLNPLNIIFSPTPYTTAAVQRVRRQRHAARAHGWRLCWRRRRRRLPWGDRRVVYSLYYLGFVLVLTM